MTKSELIEYFAERQNISKRYAEQLVLCVLDHMGEAMARGERIEIRGFGSFSMKTYGPYRGRNPKTGAKVDVKAKRSVHFKAGKDLKERVNGLTGNK